MTRINIVPVKELCNKHLFAEFREMPRLVGNLEKSLAAKKPFKMSDISPKYILGKGHVKFFYDKFEYLYKRHIELGQELLLRGYNINPNSEIFKTVDSIYFNDFKPSNEELELNRARIKERLPINPNYGKIKKLK